jgi:hypothetical protein
MHSQLVLYKFLLHLDQFLTSYFLNRRGPVHSSMVVLQNLYQTSIAPHVKQIHPSLHYQSRDILW